MLCLSVDASGPAASAALVRDGALVAERVLIREKAHASELAPMVQGVLRDALVTVADLDLVACVAGPGSFTGVRIGVALAQGIALAGDKPCCAVDALEAMAYPYRHVDVILCPILDARAGQVYGAAFAGGERLMEDQALPLDTFIEKARSVGERFLFIGDGAGPHGSAIMELLGPCADVDDSRVLRAGDGAMLALERPETWLHAAALRPIYLRAPQAERERLAREGNE